MRISLQKYGFVLLASILFLQTYSCKEKVSPIEDLIPESEMVEILEVIYVSEVKVISHFDLKGQKNDYMRKYLYPAIFDSLGIVDSSFYRSYEWYEDHPQQFEVIMDSVASRIQRMPADSATDEAAKSLDKTYRELNRVERIKSGESKQKFDDE